MSYESEIKIESYEYGAYVIDISNRFMVVDLEDAIEIVGRADKEIAELKKKLKVIEGQIEWDKKYPFGQTVDFGD